MAVEWVFTVLTTVIMLLVRLVAVHDLLCIELRQLCRPGVRIWQFVVVRVGTRRCYEMPNLGNLRSRMIRGLLLGLLTSDLKLLWAARNRGTLLRL